MDQKFVNRITMFKAVADYLEQHSSVWTGVVSIERAVQEFGEKISLLDTATVIKETPTGAAEEKAAARESLEEPLFITCEALGVLALESNDHELGALTDVTVSDIGRFTVDELFTRATKVIEAANARKAELVSLRLSQAHLDELEQAFERFNATKGKPRMSTVKRATQRATLRGSTREATDILRNRIDRLVNLFLRTNPEFVSGYRIARIVIDRRGEHSAEPQLVAQPGTDTTVH